MWIINHRRFFYALSLALVVAALGAVGAWGLNPGIDFKGGSLIEVSYGTTTPSAAEVVTALKPVIGSDVSVRETDGGFLVRTHTLDDTAQSAASDALLAGYPGAAVLRLDSIGPLLGAEAVERAVASIVLVLVAIIAFVAFAFRKVSQPVASWKFGLIAIIALAHDVIIPTGVFALLGHLVGAEVDTLFVTALLVVLGFSVHDTIVVFDRVREALRLNAESHSKTPFAEIVGASIMQTMGRSINTSLTTLLSVIALYVFGPEATKLFSLALMVGIVAGTYSSIFIASPLLVTAQAWSARTVAGK